MSRIASFFLACFLCMTMAACGKFPIPTTVDHPDKQCRARGWLGSCGDRMYVNGELNCGNVECAGPLRVNSENHRAMDIGRAIDGTHCAYNKVCYQGTCTVLPRGIRMPQEIGEDEEGFICYRANSGKMSGSPRNRPQ